MVDPQDGVGLCTSTGIECPDVTGMEGKKCTDLTPTQCQEMAVRYGCCYHTIPAEQGGLPIAPKINSEDWIMCGGIKYFIAPNPNKNSCRCENNVLTCSDKLMTFELPVSNDSLVGSSLNVSDRLKKDSKGVYLDYRDHCNKKDEKICGNETDSRLGWYTSLSTDGCFLNFPYARQCLAPNSKKSKIVLNDGNKLVGGGDYPCPVNKLYEGASWGVPTDTVNNKFNWYKSDYDQQNILHCTYNLSKAESPEDLDLLKRDYDINYSDFYKQNLYDKALNEWCKSEKNVLNSICQNKPDELQYKKNLLSKCQHDYALSKDTVDDKCTTSNVYLGVEKFNDFMLNTYCKGENLLGDGFDKCRNWITGPDTQSVYTQYEKYNLKDACANETNVDNPLCACYIQSNYQEFCNNPEGTDPKEFVDSLSCKMAKEKYDSYVDSPVEFEELKSFFATKSYCAAPACTGDNVSHGSPTFLYVKPNDCNSDVNICYQAFKANDSVIDGNVKAICNINDDGGGGGGDGGGGGGGGETPSPPEKKNNNNAGWWVLIGLLLIGIIILLFL